MSHVAICPSVEAVINDNPEPDLEKFICVRQFVVYRPLVRRLNEPPETVET